MFAARLLSKSLLLVLVGCGQGIESSESVLASHSTQNWSVNAASQPLTMVAESGECMSNPPQTGFAAGYCFNKVPAARVTVNVGLGGTMSGFCVATHLPGMASQAALLVLDSQGQLVSEVTGNGSLQLIDSFARSGIYTLYVGFPMNSGAQKVTLRVAPLSRFAVSSPACNLR